jgi:ABC-2 type transport system ATP-binding protein
MRAVLSQGTTLVFVSHDLASVEATCSRGVWLHNGVIRADAPIGESLQAYRRFIEESAESAPSMSGPVRLMKVELRGEGGGPVRSNQRLDITLLIETELNKSAPLFLGVSEGAATPIFSISRELLLAPGQLEVRCSIAHLPLPRGRFYLWAGVVRREQDLLAWHPTASFDVEGPDLDAAPRAIVRLAPVHVDAAWATERT